jgi:hypothetical protein
MQTPVILPAATYYTYWNIMAYGRQSLSRVLQTQIVSRSRNSQPLGKKLITAFIRASHWTMFWARWISHAVFRMAFNITLSPTRWRMLALATCVPTKRILQTTRETHERRVGMASIKMTGDLTLNGERRLRSALRRANIAEQIKRKTDKNHTFWQIFVM